MAHRKVPARLQQPNPDAAEVTILARYSSHVSGRRVLDLGCGAGRVLSYLVMLGADAYGLDLSPAMVDHCRLTVPEATVAVGDVATLSTHFEGKFHSVLAPDNLFDVFSDAERRAVLTQVRLALEPGGLLIFSSHDLAYLENPPANAGEEQRVNLSKVFNRTPAEIARAIVGRPMALRNRRRLRPLQEHHVDHAIVNDFPHYYSFLHYYIRRDDQERQLRELGFCLLECVDSEGRTVPPGGTGPRDYLYYVSQAT